MGLAWQVLKERQRKLPQQKKVNSLRCQICHRRERRFKIMGGSSEDHTRKQQHKEQIWRGSAQTSSAANACRDAAA